MISLTILTVFILIIITPICIIILIFVLIVIIPMISPPIINILIIRFERNIVISRITYKIYRIRCNNWRVNWLGILCFTINCDYFGFFISVYGIFFRLNCLLNLIYGLLILLRCWCWRNQYHRLLIRNGSLMIRNIRLAIINLILIFYLQCYKNTLIILSTH